MKLYPITRVRTIRLIGYHVHNLMPMPVFVDYNFTRDDFFGISSSPNVIRLIGFDSIEQWTRLRREQRIYVFHSYATLQVQRIHLTRWHMALTNAFTSRC